MKVPSWLAACRITGRRWWSPVLSCTLVSCAVRKQTQSFIFNQYLCLRLLSHFPPVHIECSVISLESGKKKRGFRTFGKTIQLARRFATLKVFLYPERYNSPLPWLQLLLSFISEWKKKPVWKQHYKLPEMEEGWNGWSKKFTWEAQRWNNHQWKSVMRVLHWSVLLCRLNSSIFGVLAARLHRLN